VLNKEGHQGHREWLVSHQVVQYSAWSIVFMCTLTFVNLIIIQEPWYILVMCSSCEICRCYAFVLMFLISILAKKKDVSRTTCKIYFFTVMQSLVAWSE
jgi:amino acid transporter